MSSDQLKQTNKGRLAAHLALLLPPNKRRLVSAAVVAAAGAYFAANYVNKQSKRASRHSKKSPPSGDLSTVVPKKNKPKRRASGQALKQILPFLLKVAGRKVLVIALLAIARTALSNRIARLQGYLFRAAFLRKVPLFTRNIIENIILCGVAAGLEATTRSWVSYMDLQWRKMLTSQIHSSYFADMTYYKLNYVDRTVDSPEQRICEDIPKLTSGLSELTKEIIVAIVDAVFYTYQLKHYSGTNKYTVAILAYVFGVGTFMTVAAPNFGSLFKKQQVLEGAYRHMHARLKNNAESVAFYGGIAKEGDLLRTKFNDVAAHTARVLGKQWRFSMVQDFLLKYCGATVAVALIIGPFFAGHMRPEATIAGRAQMLSNMRYHTSVIISLFGALGTLGASSRKFLKLGAYADRMDEMQRVMRDIAKGKSVMMVSGGGMGLAKGVIDSCDDAIEFDKATVVTPGNATLVRDLTLRVPAGTNLLVTGPNGAGKSSLFRVLGGLWPLTQGSIKKPGGGEGGLSHEIFYVPQRPYVTVGTLQDQLLYPLSPDDEHRIPQATLRTLLRDVDLEALLDRTGGGEEVTNWGEVLSLGEQQRLGMARLFYHKPRFAILDECTSGVTIEMEEKFCTMVRDMGCTCVTISHRPALMAFHDVVLNLDGEGGWSLHQGHRALMSSKTQEEERKEEERKEEERYSLGDGNEDICENGSDDGQETSVVDSTSGNTTIHAGKNKKKKQKKKKARGDDAGAILSGMNITAAPPNTTTPISTTGKGKDGTNGKEQMTMMLADGNEGYKETIIASAPPTCASPIAESWLSRRFSVVSDKKKKPSSSLSRWKAILKIIIGGDVKDSVMRLSTVAGVVFLRTLLQDRIASLNGRSVDLVLRQDLQGFIRLIGVSVLQSAASAVLAPSLKHVADNLALTWRVRLTRAISKGYLSGKVFYTISQFTGMNDVDQRMTRDVERLSEDLSALIPTLIKPVIDVVWFSWQLWKLTGPRGMCVAYAYTILGYGCLRAVTPDFAGLLKTEHYLEGAFRNAHERLRTHAESIAFFGGGPKEGAIVSRSFDALTAHARSLIHLRWGYGAADEFFAKQLPHSTTWVLTLLYALDQKGDFGDTVFQGTLVHNIRYLASVVTQCFSAFGELLAMPKRFAEISGGIQRVSEMLDAIAGGVDLEIKAGRERRARQLLLPTTTSNNNTNSMNAKLNDHDKNNNNNNNNDDDYIEFKDIDVVTPSGKVLARALTFSVSPGYPLLVTGPNGSGKTSVFRLLAGLWPQPDEHIGVVHEPGSLQQKSSKDRFGSHIYYVPQKPYTTIGTLRDQIIYPLSTPHARQRFGNENDPPKALDEFLGQLMSVVRLQYLVEREGGLDAVKEWGEVLSLGEQQRIGMARLFFHKPTFGVLDECTNATSVDVEEALYAHAEDLGITLVTITQRTALVKYHGRELRMVDGAGEWDLREIKKVVA